jgi:hypothetical protein
MAKKTRRARRADPCQGIRDRIRTVEERIQELQDFLPEAPPDQRVIIRAAIARLRELLRRLQQQLRACEREHRDG